MSRNQPESLGALDIREIVAVDAVSRTRSFKLAADALNTSQPTLSRLIASAERRLGCPLFRRGWSGAETTTQGDIAARLCKQLVAMLDEAQEQLFSGAAPAPTIKYTLRTAHLQIVDAVCRESSVTFAAARLGKTQPEVSRALNDLEKRFRLRLFQRTSSGMLPLPPAKILGDLHARLMQRLDALPEQIKRLDGGIAGRVSVGMLPFSGQDLILLAFATLTNAHPNVRLACVPGSYNALVEALRRNEIDRIIGIARGQHCPSGLEEEVLYHERYAVIARTGHPLAHEPRSLDALSRTNWIVAPHGTPVRTYFERVLSEIGVTPPTQTCELLSFGSAEQMLVASNSVAVLSYSARKLARLRPELCAVETGFPASPAPIAVTRSRNVAPEPALEAFDTVLRRAVAEHEHPQGHADFETGCSQNEMNGGSNRG